MAAMLRRFLVVSALLFWQGGFIFYAAVVVHVGSDVLGSHMEQGFITRRVTNYLNLAGTVALPIFAWDAAVSRRGAARWRRLRWAAWLVMALTLGLLAWLHVRLDALLDPSSFDVLDRAAFRAWHRVYLWTSTAQWACALVYSFSALWVWREEDRAAGAATVSRLTGEATA
jgi:hypothetical protein